MYGLNPGYNSTPKLGLPLTFFEISSTLQVCQIQKSTNYEGLEVEDAMLFDHTLTGSQQNSV